VEINLVGTWNLLRCAAAAMAKTDAVDEGERGVVVLTSSIAGIDGHHGRRVAYASSKAGVEGITLPAARALAEHGIRVMCIAPGLMDTPLNRRIFDENAMEKLRSELIQFPGRLGHADEFGELVLMICDNAYLNGSHVRLDAAMRMPAVGVQWSRSQ
jgi:NAD(P)-dependent dehydrogenase (short-subunit alcohol dehydrogenase family)